MKIDNIKEEMTNDMENFRKKLNINMKHNGRPLHRLKQAEDRISEFEMEIKGKLGELLHKQLKTCERNIQELTDTIKRPNLRIMGIEEGEEVQAKEIDNIFNKIITEKSPNLEKLCPFRYRKPPGHQTDLTKIELPYNTLSLK
jgi:chromosome segregation ATPase